MERPAVLWRQLLRTAVETLTGEELAQAGIHRCAWHKGHQGGRHISVAGMDIRVAVASGLGNARELLEQSEIW